MKQFDQKKCEEFVNKKFYQSVVPSLEDFIRIPNLSRSYDAQWKTNGRLQQAANHLKKWVQALQIKGLKIQIIKDQEFSPLIFTQIQGQNDETILFYGHFDKQPPFTGWDQGLGPTTPVIKNGRLYGRGGADDGYSTYGSLLAVKAVQEQGVSLPRCIMITEGDQESGSGHMVHYLQKLKQRIGKPTLIFCLDSTCLDYDRLWLTNSLRGNLVATVQVKTLNEGVHSGDASGVTPSCFRIMSQIINRIENIETGEVNKLFHVDIPSDRYTQCEKLIEIMGQNLNSSYPFHKDTKPLSNNPMECTLRRTWRPTLTVTGQNGLPQVATAGNVMLPQMEVRFSLRMPPTLKHQQAVKNLTELIESNPPYGAHVEVKNVRAAKGWNSRRFDAKIEKALNEASQFYFHNQRLSMGVGASIPVMGMFDKIWPNGQFIITGVLGPNSNAHGPNQFLHLQYTKKLICCIAHVVGNIQ